MPKTLTRRLDDDGATCALGTAIAPLLRPGLSIHLCGPLGAGKTALVRAVLRALGERGRVRSPTFTLVEPYRVGGLDLLHLDLYRFEQASEWGESGFDEYLGGDAVTLIEWPERAAALLPAPDLKIELAIDGPGRLATLTAHRARGRALLEALSAPPNEPPNDPPSDPRQAAAAATGPRTAAGGRPG
jgi:tRNA threonylcarbamoyladenosine biosynthesis protein TsaE